MAFVCVCVCGLFSPNKPISKVLYWFDFNSACFIFCYIPVFLVWSRCKELMAWNRFILWFIWLTYRKYCGLLAKVDHLSSLFLLIISLYIMNSIKMHQSQNIFPKEETVKIRFYLIQWGTKNIFLWNNFLLIAEVNER